MNQAKTVFQNKYKELGIPTPALHFVLGSLIGQELKEVSALFPAWEKRGDIAFSEIPGLSNVSSPSHLGAYEYFYHPKKQKSICFQTGRLHGYEGLTPHEVARTVTGPCAAGTSCFVLTNISGGLTKNWPAGSITAITDHINFTGQSPLTGLSKKAPKSFYFPDMQKAYDPDITKAIASIMKSKGLDVRSGLYIGVLGPQFETPAEVRMFARYGADVVGMSTVWEVIALHYAKARISAFSIVANPACGVGNSVQIHPKALKPSFTSALKSFFEFATAF